MPATGFIIEERTGRRRRVVLKGRALPHGRPGLELATEQRHTTTWYNGNPQATLQILGPKKGPTVIEGGWMARYLPGTVEVRGFEEVRMPADLLAVFNDLCDSGNLLRVEWGPEVRFGILASFRGMYRREEDAGWEAEFVWTGIGATFRVATQERNRNGAGIGNELNELDNLLSSEPFAVIDQYRNQVLYQINRVRNYGNAIIDLVRQAGDVLRAPAEIAQAVVGAVDGLRLEADLLLESLAEIPATYVEVSEDVIDTLFVETWRRALAFQLGLVVDAAEEERRNLEPDDAPGALRFVTVPGDTTLRELARQHLGDPDAWQTIADLNGLTSSIAPAGFVLILPPGSEAS